MSKFSDCDSPELDAHSDDDSSSESLQLDISTLDILDSFLSARVEEENRFNALANGLEDSTSEDEPMISIEEYFEVFREDYQLSQFWYTVPFAKRFAAGLQKLCSPSSTVAFLCCPTTFVAFQNGNTEKIQTYLLEVDRRFEVLAPKQYVYYDLDEPDNFPDFLKGSIDLAVVDPPFLNDRTNRKILQTLKKILHPKNGRLILLTSTSIESELDDIYTEPPVGPLYKTSLAVQHGQLANSFACWGSFPGVQAFDEEDP